MHRQMRSTLILMMLYVLMNNATRMLQDRYSVGGQALSCSRMKSERLEVATQTMSLLESRSEQKGWQKMLRPKYLELLHRVASNFSVLASSGSRLGQTRRISTFWRSLIPLGHGFSNYNGLLVGNLPAILDSRISTAVYSSLRISPRNHAGIFPTF